FGSKICFDKGGGLGNFELDQSYFRCRNVICCRNGSFTGGGRFVPVTNSKGRHLSGLIFFRHPPSRSTVLAMSTFGGRLDDAECPLLTQSGHWPHQNSVTGLMEYPAGLTPALCWPSGSPSPTFRFRQR